MNERSMENNPGERYQDKGYKARVKNWWGPGRGYRDLWMIGITIVVLFATKANYDNIKDTERNSQATNKLAIETARLAGEIQKSREEFFLYSCEQQNVRGTKTIRRLNDLIANQDENQQPGTEERRFFTLALINELAPKQDCDRLVKQLVQVP